TKDGDVILARDPTDFSKIVSEGAQTVKNVAALAESLKGTAESLRQSKLIEDASATLASARKVTDQVGRIVTEVEKGRGWAHALIYDEPVALRKMNDVIASTQRLLDRVERGEGAAGVLTSDASTASARRPHQGRAGRREHPPGVARFASRVGQPQGDHREDQRGRRHPRRPHRRSDGLRASRHDPRGRSAELPAPRPAQEPRRRRQAEGGRVSPRATSVYRCQECGFASPKPGTCPDCLRGGGAYVQLVEERSEARTASRRPGAPSSSRPQPLKDVVL